MLCTQLSHMCTHVVLWDWQEKLGCNPMDILVQGSRVHFSACKLDSKMLIVLKSLMYQVGCRVAAPCVNVFSALSRVVTLVKAMRGWQKRLIMCYKPAAEDWCLGAVFDELCHTQFCLC